MDKLHQIALLWVLAGAAGCGSSEGIPDKDLGGLVHAEASVSEVVDLERATRPEVLTAALAVPHRRLATALGPHRFVAHTELSLAGDPGEQLVVDTEVRVDADGNYLATSNNSEAYGREVIWAGGALHLRPRYGAYHRRKPTADDEPAAILDQLFTELAAQHELIGHALTATDAGATQVAGRSGRKIELTLAGGTPKAPAATRADRKWRESVVVREARGHVVLDSETGALLAGELSAAVELRRDDDTRRMDLKVSQGVTDIGNVAAVAPPAAEDIVDTPLMSRELDDRNQLLEGLAPPGRRAAAPATGGP